MSKKIFLLASLVVLWIESGFSAQPSPVIGRVTAADPVANTFAVETQHGGVTFKADDGILSRLRIGEHVRVVSTSGVRGPIASFVERFEATPVTGSVAAVDVSEGQVTIEMPQGSPALERLNAGDPVKIQLAPGALGAPRIDEGLLGASGSLLRRSFGLWLLAITGTIVALRARRMRLV